LRNDARDGWSTYATKNGIKWTQGFLGEWSQATLPNQ